MNTGQRISLLREKKNQSQAELAKTLGIAASTVGMQETNKRKPSSKMLKKLSVLYDVSIDYLLGNDSTTDKAPSEVDIADPKNDTIMTFEGRPIPPEDLEIIKRLLRGGKHDD